jgi:hypothetical protein
MSVTLAASSLSVIMNFEDPAGRLGIESELPTKRVVDADSGGK